MTAAALSVVVVTPTDYGQIRAVIEALAAQTIAARIELVIIAPHDGVRAPAGPILGAFHSHRIIAVGPIPNVDVAVARGLLEGTAPIIATIEDHAFPDPDWAERLLEVWDDTCAGVGPAVTNGNPDSGLSWTNLMIAYGAWAEDRPEGPHDAAPIHNGSFRRAALEPLRDALPATWNREGGALKLLKARGATFRFAPRARVRHLNPSTIRATAALRFDAGRLYAAERARSEGWGKGKCLVYAGLGPLIPLVRYLKMRRELFGPGRAAEGRRGPWLFLGLVFDAAGQMAGYLAGPGGARDRLATFEMDRAQHLNRADRRRFYPGR